MSGRYQVEPHDSGLARWFVDKVRNESGGDVEPDLPPDATVVWFGLTTLNLLRDLEEVEDGVYDGACIWIGGVEYPVLDAEGGLA